MKCIICAQQTKSYQHPKFDLLFHECPNCEVIFKDPKHHLNQSDEFNVYEQHQNSIDNIGYVNFLTNFIEAAVIPFIKEASNLSALDFGSGPQPVLSMILKRDFKISSDVYDIFYAPKKVYEYQTYDLITSTEVIEHLSQPKEVFELFSKHLNNQGICCIMTLFHPKNQESFFDWFYIRDPSHIVFYTATTLRILGDLVGLKLIFDNNHRYATFVKV